jgi:hypothetical protein
VAPVGRGDELCRDADAIAGLSDAAFQDVRYSEGQSDLANVLMLALECESRGARDHPQIRNFGQQIDDLLGKAVAQVFVLLVAAHVLDWQDGDRRLRVGRACRHLFERGLHVVHRRESLAWLLGQASPDDSLEAVWRREGRRVVA